ncbi:TrkH family potassium uptake protein [Bacillota bacterium Meth-B3]
MNIRLVLSLLGRAMMVEGALLLPSAAVALMHGEDPRALLQGALLVAALGLLIVKLSKPKNTNLRAREGLASVALIWVALSFFGGLPFYFDGAIPSLTDCFFETVSGFTTTGATILTDVEALPKGLLFWRSFTHWVGGMGVLVLSLALLPNMGARTGHLMKAESTGPAPGKLVPRIAHSSRILYKLYLALTLLQLVALLMCGLNLYDALIHTFGAAGTGGFSNYALSAGHFQSPAVEMVLAAGMLLFGVNFSMYFLLLGKQWKSVLRNEELRLYLSITLVATALIAVNILPGAGDIWTALRQSFFQVSTIITTTGYSSVNFDKWPEFSRWILVLLMLVGSCAGSTAGGIKMVRLNLLLKSVKHELYRAVHPNGVAVVKTEGRAVGEGVLGQVLVFFFAYLLALFLAVLIISLDGFDMVTNLTAALSALSNIGPGLNIVGPLGSFTGYSILSKWVLSACMLIGRLEIYPMLLLVIPSMWRRH